MVSANAKRTYLRVNLFLLKLGLTLSSGAKRGPCQMLARNGSFLSSEILKGREEILISFLLIDRHGR